MARLLLALYLPACLFGSSGLVLCAESDSSLVLEWVLEGCCEESEAGATTPSASHRQLQSGDECACTDFSADLLLTQRLDLNHPSRALPPVLPAALPPIAGIPAADSAAWRRAGRVEATCRPELPGVGACPRVLRD